MHGSRPVATVPFLLMALPAFSQEPKFTGPAAFGDWHPVDRSRVRVAPSMPSIRHPDVAESPRDAVLS